MGDYATKWSFNSGKALRRKPRRRLKKCRAFACFLTAVVIVTFGFYQGSLLVDIDNAVVFRNNVDTALSMFATESSVTVAEKKHEAYLSKRQALIDMESSSSKTVAAEFNTSLLRTKQQQQQPQSPLLLDQMATKNNKKCAILLFGLPRAFQEYVLPSLRRNVIGPNAKYHCDYFVHYYDQTSEPAGRSGKGGNIRPDDIFLLRDVVHQVHENQLQQQQGITTQEQRTPPIVSFVADTNQTFWEKRGAVVKRYQTETNPDGNYKFFPYAEQTYEYPHTMDNIVKQWHSIQAVWEAMATSSKASGNNVYDRVALIRSDVIYLTPIDIYQRNDTTCVIPNFAKWPVNDRMMIGPTKAVELWANERFTKIEDYAVDPLHEPGMVLHAETFLNASILQTIKEMEVTTSQTTTTTHYTIFEDPNICFLRVRADGAIWIEDCDASKSGFNGGYPGGMKEYIKILKRHFLGGKKCSKRKVRDKLRIIYELHCR